MKDKYLSSKILESSSKYREVNTHLKISTETEARYMELTKNKRAINSASVWGGRWGTRKTSPSCFQS